VGKYELIEGFKIPFGGEAYEGKIAQHTGHEEGAARDKNIIDPYLLLVMRVPSKASWS
jgi:hypothetical protein